jgi:hypothetical protein
MIIPIHVPTRDHWILAVIDFKNKKTMIYDSIERDSTQPAHPEIHAHLKAWMTREHQARSIPFDVKEWEARRVQQTPQQGYGKDVGVDCGVFVIAFAMYLSASRPFGLSQADMSSLRNWIAQTMIGFGIGNNTFDPMKDADDLEMHSINMDRWTLLVKDCASCPLGSKRKVGHVEPTPRTKLTKTAPPPATIRAARVRQVRKLKNTGIRDTVRPAGQIWQPPLDALPRGIRNTGCSCSAATALQLCFHIAPLARILQEPLPQPAAFLTVDLQRYTTGNGPLDLQNLDPILDTSKPEEAGELLSQFLSQIRAAKPECKLPTTLSFRPAETLLFSLRTTTFTSPRPCADGDSNTIIFQIDRANLSGRKNTKMMQFLLKLGRECQVIARCGSMGMEYELQSVVVHQDDSKKGHYNTFLKPAGGPHWALFDDDIVKWVQEKEVMEQEATILVYTRPDGVVETETIIIPDDGQEDSRPREVDDSGSITPTTGDNTLGKAGRESADTRQSSAQGNMLEAGDHSLYRELLERAFQDPATEESDLDKMMPGPSNKDQQLQEVAKQRQETRFFQDYLQKHGLREEEVEVFGNCLFLSIARHVTKEADKYSSETPEDPESRYKGTASMIRNLALDHMLRHRSSFESSFGKKSSTLMVNDQIVADNEKDSVMEEVQSAEMERDALNSALDLDLDSYCGRMRSETAQGDELTIRAAAGALQINIRVLKLNSTTTSIMALTYPGTPTDLEEDPGTLNSLAGDASGHRTITIAHYVHQHGGAGHYNPIFQQNKSDCSIEEMDTVVDDEESSDSGSDELGKNSEPVATWANSEPAATSVERPLVASATMDIEGEVEDVENPDGRRDARGKAVGNETLRSATSTTRITEGPQNPAPMHISWTTERATAAAEKKAGLLQFQRALRRKLTPRAWTSAGALDIWLSGRNKRMPCRILATLDPVKIREWIGPGQFIPFIKNCDFVIWKQGERDIEFSLPDPNPVTGTSEGRRVVTPPPLLGPVRKPLPYNPLRQNPTDVRRQDTTIQLSRLLDWLSERLGSRIPSQGEERDIQRAKGRRLSRDLRGFDESEEHKEEDLTLTHPEQLLQEGKEWFLKQQVGPFLDRVRNRARGPEQVRLRNSQSVRLYVSNLRARTKDDIISKLRGMGLQLLREDLAKFELKYSKKLRLETSALTVLVLPDERLVDFMQGEACIEGIRGPATFTILNDEVDTVHQAELKPNSQIDRKRLPLLTNIWTTLGASEAQFMTWILLCSSSQDAHHLDDWLPESVAISSPDGPAHLPTIWGSKNQKWHRGHITLQSGSPLVQKQSRDTLAAVTSIAGVDKLYETEGLDNTMTPPRKPAKIPRRVVRVGLPATEKVDTWVSLNKMLARDETLAEEAARILRAAPRWLQRCGIHANMDPVLGRCSWEEDSSISIRFRQTQRKRLLHVDRTTMRLDTCAMLNKLQKICWPDNANFEIQDVECVSYIAHNTTTEKRLEGMITVNYRPHIPMEQDILVGVLLAMYMGNDIPNGERGCAHKW